MAHRGQFNVDDGKLSEVLMDDPEGNLYIPTGKARRRLLEKFNNFPMSEGLVEELKEMRRRDSASSLSEVSMYLEDDNKEACNEDCWLLGQLPERKESVSMPAVAMDAPVAFSYEPLEKGQIRVLRLQPGTSHEPIVTSLLHLQLRSGEDYVLSDYETLSYTWGSPTPQYTITCNEMPLSVGANLLAALYRLRLPDRERLLWIDAICINQGDIPEKNDQVRSMIDVYRQARRGIVWLGDVQDESELAIACALHLDTSETHRELFWEREHHATCLSNLGTYWKALQRLYGRSWFYRTWIRQEVAVAQEIEVYCGASKMSWGCLKRTEKRFRDLRRMLPDELADAPEPSAPPSALTTTSLLKKGWKPGDSVLGMIAEDDSLYRHHTGQLLELLISGRGFDATNTRDLVYAYLGLAQERVADSTEASDSAMIIDYGSSVSEVYQRLAKYHINKTRSLDILCILSNHRGRSSGDLPSWTADWRIPISEKPILNCWEDISLPVNTTGDSQADYQDQSDIGHLRVRGYFVDKIDTLLPFAADLQKLMEVWHKCREEDISQIQALYQIGTPFEPETQLRRCCVGEQLENMFLVPAASQEGDLVTLLEGARLPFILRLVKQAENQDPERYFVAPDSIYQVIGPCLLPGTHVWSDWQRFKDHMVAQGPHGEPLAMILE